MHTPIVLMVVGIPGGCCPLILNDLVTSGSLQGATMASSLGSTSRCAGAERSTTGRRTQQMEGSFFHRWRL